MAKDEDPYDSYVEHPRYGRRPKWTGLNPVQDFSPDNLVYLHWHSGEDCRIPNTAIPADTDRQQYACVPVTHYFDAERTCRDCGRPFLFFALEQKHWYEELGFGLDADCVRCVPCRRAQRGLEGQRARYEQLFHVEARSPAEELEMAECSLALVAAGLFGVRQLDTVRARLRRLEGTLEGELRDTLDRMLSRLEEARAATRSPEVDS